MSLKILWSVVLSIHLWHDNLHVGSSINFFLIAEKCLITLW